HIQHLYPMVEKNKLFYLIAGFLLTALAAIGAVLPLLPTTPFLLLAAWCFSQSSEKCHRWLTEHKIFGSIIKNWEENKCIPRKAKFIAVSSMLIFGTYAIGFAIDNLYVRIAGSLFCLTGLIFVLRIPVCKKD
ncbi:MAG: YbaN family protein, partial [Pontiella sp.]